MTNVLVPCRVNNLRKIKSRQIVAEFLAATVSKLEVDVARTGRQYTSVYTSLIQWLEKHPTVEVDVAQVDGTIVLYRRSVGANSSVCNKAVGH
jgi:hypothetical protein